MYRFAVFDVETPNRFNDRMSAVGITVMEEGEITEEYYTLVNPETFFDTFNISLTGIHPAAVQDAPTFPDVWEKIEPLMSNGILVAHNAVFDLGVLRRCLKHYEIPWKKYARYLCTVQMGRKVLPGMSHKLNVLSDYYGIPLEHHIASSDSHACAVILQNYIKEGADPKQFIRTYRISE